MEVRFELLTLFRERAGQGELVLGVEDLRPGGPVLPALRAFDEHFAGRGLAVLAEAGRPGAGLRPGVLVFLKAADGRMTRVRSPADPLPGGTRAIVLSTGMEGG